MEKNIDESQVLIHFGQSLENNCVYLKSLQMWHSLVTGGHEQMEEGGSYMACWCLGKNEYGRESPSSVLRTCLLSS